MTDMRLEISNARKADIFTTMFQNIKLFTVSMSVTFDIDRLYVQGMDSGHVSIFEINLTKDWFDVYELSEPVTIGMSTIIFHKILNTRGADHTLMLALDADDQDRLNIEFRTEDKGEFNKSFHMPLMDIDTDHMCIPETDYDLEFTLASKKMKSIVDELSHFGDTLTISFADDTVFFAAETATEGSMKLKAGIEDFDRCAVDDEAKIECGYATRFVQFMTHFHKLNKACTLFIQTDVPMQFRYSLDVDGEGEGGGEGEKESTLEQQNYARFFLAPKISDSDE